MLVLADSWGPQCVYIYIQITVSTAWFPLNVYHFLLQVVKIISQIIVFWELPVFQMEDQITHTCHSVPDSK